MPINYSPTVTFLLYANMLKITTSWDDGDVLDIRLSRLLSKYGVKGTFYISQNYRENRLSEFDIVDISKIHEIGAHTVSHLDLRTLSTDDKRDEVRKNKEWLQRILGAEVKMFCYPRGLYDDAVVKTVQEAGFLGARTTKLGSISSPSDSFHLDTTIQIYPFPFRKRNTKQYYARKFLQPYLQRAPALRSIGVPTSSMYSWLNTAKTTFDLTKQKGEIFHLWGHSWEIEKYGMWDELENFLLYVACSDRCIYLTNGELLRRTCSA